MMDFQTFPWMATNKAQVTEYFLGESLSGHSISSNTYKANSRKASKQLKKEVKYHSKDGIMHITLLALKIR